MYHHFNERSGQNAPLIADDVYEIITKVINFFSHKFFIHCHTYIGSNVDDIILTMYIF